MACCLHSCLLHVSRGLNWSDSTNDTVSVCSFECVCVFVCLFVSLFIIHSLLVAVNINAGAISKRDRTEHLVICINAREKIA